MQVSGIYAILSKRDIDKIYIGSAINLAARKKRHFRELASGKHFNSKLQNYYNKHGPDCFDFYVIQHVKPKYLLSCEQFHIDAQKPYFNINPTAGSRFGAKHSLRSKLKTKTSLLGTKHVSMLRHLWHRVAKHQV